MPLRGGGATTALSDLLTGYPSATPIEDAADWKTAPPAGWVATNASACDTLVSSGGTLTGNMSTSNVDWTNAGTHTAPLLHRVRPLGLGARMVLGKIITNASANYEYCGLAAINSANDNQGAMIRCGYDSGQTGNYTVTAWINGALTHATSATDASITATALGTNGVWVAILVDGTAAQVMYSTATAMPTTLDEWTIITASSTVYTTISTGRSLKVGVNAITVNTTGNHAWSVSDYDDSDFLRGRISAA